MSRRLERVFSENPGRKIVSLFITAGFPHPQETVDLVCSMADAGADIIELGIPFSDPLADGPTIQFSSDVAIKYGTDLDKMFEMMVEIRHRSDVPVIFMGYSNPVFHYGLEKFMKRCLETGVDGLIIPDLPPEETPHALRNAAVPMIYLVAPNTTDERMRFIDDRSHPFVYCVSVTGVTGARSAQEVADSVAGFRDRVKTNVVKNRAMVGFGIKNGEDAKVISKGFDGFIVGSALIDLIRNEMAHPHWKSKLLHLVKELRLAAG
jgi:tryptophan synthase alpha chain